MYVQHVYSGFQGSIAISHTTTVIILVYLYIFEHYSQETHPYLAEESIIEGIRYACTFNRIYFMSATERRLDKLLLT